MAEPALALATQVGGDHYKRWPIQPVEFAEVNELSACQSAIVKYILRYDLKDGAKDLRKAAHYCDLMVELSDRRELSWRDRAIDWRLADGKPTITLEEFVAANQLPKTIERILILVCLSPSPVRLMSARLLIDELAENLPH